MSKLIELNETNFESNVLKAKVPVLVDFHSVFCAPCNALKPVLSELAKDVGEQAKVFTVEIGTNERLAEQYAIRVVPTLIVFYKGRLIHRLVGLQSKDFLKVALEV